MKGLLKTRDNVIIALCITIILLGIGFILLSVKLKEKEDYLNVFDVSFVDVTKSSSIKGSIEEPKGNYEFLRNNKEVQFDITMNSTHDELSYIVVLKNTGNIPCEIVDLMESPSYSVGGNFSYLIDPVTISVTDIKGKVILPDEELPFKIIVYYNPSVKTLKPISFTYKLGVLAKSK